MDHIDTPDASIFGAESISKVQVRPDPLKGRMIVGRYRINARLARGGMSSIYLARDVQSGVLVAVKVLRPDLVLRRRVRLRFLNESRAVQRIDHPAVVRIHDVGETDEGRLCLVMDYVLGRSLRQGLIDGPIQPDQAIPIMKAIAEGLAAAHEQCVIHRDLKPENVLLPRKASDGSVAKLVDFGIARIVDTPRITTTQHIMGTPQYIAPEQAMGKEVDHRADIYAYGVMLYEILTGRLPFYGDDPDILLRQHICTPPPPLSANAPTYTIPQTLRLLAMRCLSKLPENRPANMYEILETLGTISL